MSGLPRPRYSSDGEMAYTLLDFLFVSQVLGGCVRVVSFVYMVLCMCLRVHACLRACAAQFQTLKLMNLDALPGALQDASTASLVWTLTQMAEHPGILERVRQVGGAHRRWQGLS